MEDRIELSACTSIMVGKAASLDGATYISRNEDRLIAIHPKRFLVQPAVSGRKETYTSPYNGLTVPLPEAVIVILLRRMGMKVMVLMRRTALTKRTLVKVPQKVFMQTNGYWLMIHLLKTDWQKIQ